jgi:acyl carrier protein
LLNQYGASEMNDVCWQELNGETTEPARFVSIGRPINNMRVYLLDWAQRPVGLGSRGEIYVQSESPARCYLARPETTAEKFVPDHISGNFGGRLYRMGDLARYLPDGRLEHLGRWDHQVKIRGMRVELRGVETVLRAHPEIAEAVVQARADEEGGELKLVAYAVRKPNSNATANELRRYLREQLAEYMVPAAIVFLDSMPLLPNKKIDRRALPDPRQARSDGPDETYLPPQTKIEQIIARIWQEVLNVEKVGLQDNFFDLGGHSLAVARVQSKLREALAKDISILELFKNPTVSSLAKFFNDEQVQELSFQKVADRGSKRKQMALLRHEQRSKGVGVSQ